MNLTNDFKQNSICWNSISAGVVVTLIVALLFNLLGAAIGFSIFSPKNEIVEALSRGTIFWLFISGIIAMYLGGWVSGYFSHTTIKLSGLLYGFIVGGISTFISLIIMITTLGVLITSSFSALGSLMSTAGSTVQVGTSTIYKGLQGISQLSPELGDKIKKAIPDLRPVLEKIKQQVGEVLPTQGENNATQPRASKKIKAELEKLIEVYLNSTEEDKNAEVKLTEMLVQTTGKSPEEVKKLITEWHDLYKEAKEKAYQGTLETSKKFSHLISKLALINFFLLLSGLIAGGIGGLQGTRKISCQEK